MAVSCLCLVFPTETHQGFLPEQVMEVWLQRGLVRWFLSPAVVSATFPLPVPASLCKLFEFAVRTFVV